MSEAYPRKSFYKIYNFKQSIMLSCPFLVCTDPVCVIVRVSLFLTLSIRFFLLRLERVTARPDEYENGFCAEVCGEM
jgi:hypothetical protein